MNDLETWITTGSVFRINFGNKAKLLSDLEAFVASEEKYEQLSLYEQPNQAVSEFFDVLPQDQQELSDKETRPFCPWLSTGKLFKSSYTYLEQRAQRKMFLDHAVEVLGDMNEFVDLVIQSKLY